MPDITIKQLYFCELHNIEKYMKFSIYKKETNYKKYHNALFCAVNFEIDKDEPMQYLNHKAFSLKDKNSIRRNKYGRGKEICLL